MKNNILRSPIRYDVALPARFRSKGELSWNEATLANLSATGLCLVAPETDLSHGQKVELLIETTDKFLRRVQRRIQALVIWSRGGRHGLEFEKKRS